MSLRPRSPSAPVSRIFAVKDPDTLRSLCGPHHQNLERLEQRFEDFSLRAESQGGGIMLLIVAIDYRHFEQLAIPLYGVSLFLLALTLVVAPVNRGSQAWLFQGRL